jgi:hypothetical protein
VQRGDELDAPDRLGDVGAHACLQTLFLRRVRGSVSGQGAAAEAQAKASHTPCRRASRAP